MTNTNNHAHFTGRLAREVIFKGHKPNSDGVLKSATAIFTVAVQDNFESTNHTGGQEYKTHFIQMTTFVNKQSDIKKFNLLRTGDLVNIEAHFESNNKDGKYFQNIILDSIQNVEPKHVRDARATKQKEVAPAKPKEVVGIRV